MSLNRMRKTKAFQQQGFFLFVGIIFMIAKMKYFRSEAHACAGTFLGGFGAG